MTSPDAWLPNRAIKIRRTGVWPGPGIADDWMIVQDPVVVEDAVIIQR